MISLRLGFSLQISFFDILWLECGCLLEKQYPCPLDMGLVFISRLHCRRSSFCQCNRLCGYSLVFYGRRFLFLRAKLKPGFRGQVLANQGPRVQLFGEESRMLLPKLAKRNESNHSLLPFFCASLM